MLMNPIPDVLDAHDIDMIAHLYKGAPADLTDAEIIRFRKFVVSAAKAAVKKTKVVVEFVEGQPYDDADQLRADVAKGVLKISTDFNSDPLNGPEANLQFRIKHDLDHAATADCNFELWGECCAFAKFAADAKGDATLINILFSEIVGALCFLRTFHTYGDQRDVAHVFAPWAIQVCQAYGVEYNVGNRK